MNENSYLDVEWATTKLSRIIKRIDSGVSVKGNDRPAKEAELGVLKVSSVTSGRFDSAQNKVVSDPSEQQRLSCPVARGDTLMTRSNGSADLVGACAFVLRDHPNLYLSDKLWRFVLADERRDDSAWLYYLLASAPVKQRILNSSSGSVGMRNVSKRELLGITVRHPSFVEQQKIAAILSTWDRAFELTEKLIAAKQKRKQALMQQLLTGNVRFKEFEGQRWKTVKLGKVFQERRETGCVDLPLLSVTAGEGIVYRDSLDRKDNSTADKSKYLRICPGDIGYNTMRMWQGVSALSEYEGIVSPAYTICTPSPGVDGRFMSYLFKYPPMVRTFWRYSQGMVSDTLNLKFSAFATISTQLPSKAEQERIGNVLRAVDDELSRLVDRKSRIEHQKKGLMQQLLTGKVRVNVEEAEMAKG